MARRWVIKMHFETKGGFIQFDVYFYVFQSVLMNETLSLVKGNPEALMNLCRFFHSTLRLSFPRNFQQKRPSIMKLFDRSEIKEKVQSLYPSDWETVFESSKSPKAGNVRVVEASDTNIPSQLVSSNIAEFLRNESGQEVDVFWKSDSTDQMMILEIDSARTRLAIGEALIRRVTNVSH